uniref:Uncharacterized protein n=1 Tax=Panagrolaimus superbus TaxID=310955 RepID=A0A914ZAH5_9BILA
MNPNNRLSRSSSRFSPIDEHPKDGISPSSHSLKHSPQNNTQTTAQLDFGPEKFDTYQSIIRTNSVSAAANANDNPLSRQSSGFQNNNKGSKENLFNEPIVIPIVHTNSIPRLSIDVKNGNNIDNNRNNEEWERHEVQVKYHNERTGYPPAYHHPIYYEDYGYNNRLQFPHQTMLSSPYHHYYPQPDYPMSPKSIRKTQHVFVGNNTYPISPAPPISSPHQTIKSTSKSHKSNAKTKKQQKTTPKQKTYHKIHCCCFSFIWPPFAYEICEPPQPMYFTKAQHSKIPPSYVSHK